MRQTEKRRKAKTRRKAGGKGACGQTETPQAHAGSEEIGQVLLISGSAVIFSFVLAAAAAIVLWLNAHGRSSLTEKAGRKSDRSRWTQMAEEPETVGSSLPPGALRYHGKAYQYKEDILTFLCMGIDRKGEVEASDDLFKGGQADSLFLAVLDPDEKTDPHRRHQPGYHDGDQRV